jgi:hypothetical protein
MSLLPFTLGGMFQAGRDGWISCMVGMCPSSMEAGRGQGTFIYAWMDGIAGLIVMERMYLQKESRADLELYFLFFPQTNTNKNKSRLLVFFLFFSPFLFVRCRFLFSNAAMS